MLNRILKAVLGLLAVFLYFTVLIVIGYLCVKIHKLAWIVPVVIFGATAEIYFKSIIVFLDKLFNKRGY